MCGFSSFNYYDVNTEVAAVGGGGGLCGAASGGRVQKATK
jgi:hypothetical protein